MEYKGEEMSFMRRRSLRWCLRDEKLRNIHWRGYEGRRDYGVSILETPASSDEGRGAIAGLNMLRIINSILHLSRMVWITRVLRSMC